jgi:hypothetical protein
MLESGTWRPTATPADPLTIGFHLSSLYSPVGWLSWERIAREWDSPPLIKRFCGAVTARMG